ncbi:MAG: pyridoxamine 5'-phosphate oxidase family protein [Egibacteraceae bacterium]
MLNPAPLEPLSTDECLRLLELRQVGRIAVVLDKLPEIVPASYRLFQDTLIVRPVYDAIDLDTVDGQLVAFEVGDTDEGVHSEWSVVVHGPAERIQCAEEPGEGHGLPSCLCILPTTITGRRIGHGHDYSISLTCMPGTWYG